jgi:hypothetical protein
LATLPNASPAIDALILPSTKRKQPPKLFFTQGLNHGGLFQVQRGLASCIEVEMAGFEGCTGLWSLQENEDYFLGISFVSETRVMRLSEDSLVDISESSGLMLESSSLFIGLLPSLPKTFIQITCDGIVLSHLEVGRLMHWKSAERILFGGVAGDGESILILTRSHILYKLKVVGGDEREGLRIVERENLDLKDQVTSLHLPLRDGLPSVCVLGTYKPSIMMVDIPTMRVLSEIALGE